MGYPRPKWTLADQRRALKEGWALFDLDDGVRASIQKDDEQNIFGNDYAANLHVVRQESLGSAFHGRALAALGYAQLQKRRPNRGRTGLKLAEMVTRWAKTPLNHGGNPYLLPMVIEARRLLEQSGIDEDDIKAAADLHSLVQEGFKEAR